MTLPFDHISQSATISKTLPILIGQIREDLSWERNADVYRNVYEAVAGEADTG